jgi:hypothetical protein
MKRFFYAIFMLSLLSIFGINCTKAGDSLQYNTVVDYEKGKVLKFPDLNVEFVEERGVTSDMPNNQKLTIKVFDFKVFNDKTSKVVSWSSGAGDIAPTDFEFEGSNYQLEMINSEALKQRIKRTQIVIVKK